MENVALDIMRLSRQEDRDEQGIEVPFLRDYYKLWLATIKKNRKGNQLTERSQRKYFEDILLWDDDILISPDLYEMLPAAFETGDFNKVKDLIDFYAKAIDQEVKSSTSSASIIISKQLKGKITKKESDKLLEEDGRRKNKDKSSQSIRNRYTSRKSSWKVYVEFLLWAFETTKNQ